MSVERGSTVPSSTLRKRFENARGNKTIVYLYPLNPYSLFSTDAFKTVELSILGISGRPSNWPVNIRISLRDIFRSDHYNFWNADPSLPAIFITDTADFRGFMQQCYHKDCDNINHVTPEMVTFMGRTTDSVVEVVTNMTNEKCQMKKTGKILDVFRSLGSGSIPGEFPLLQEMLN